MKLLATEVRPATESSIFQLALGILIYEMVAGENLFYYDGISQMDLLQSICQEKFYPLPNSVSEDEAFYVVDGLLRKDPTLRLGSTACPKKWFSELVLDDLRQKKHAAPYIPDNEIIWTISR
jgi:serine/threonine protein kinase